MAMEYLKKTKTLKMFSLKGNANLIYSRISSLTSQMAIKETNDKKYL